MKVTRLPKVLNEMVCEYCELFYFKSYLMYHFRADTLPGAIRKASKMLDHLRFKNYKCVWLNPGLSLEEEGYLLPFEYAMFYSGFAPDDARDYDDLAKRISWRYDYLVELAHSRKEPEPCRIIINNVFVHARMNCYHQLLQNINTYSSGLTRTILKPLWMLRFKLERKCFMWSHT